MSSNVATPNTVVPSGVALGSSGAAGGGGPVGPTGPRVVSTDAGNRALLGSDSLLYTPAALPLASISLNGALRQVSGSNRDLIDGSNNSQEIEVASTWKKRYYYCWHCDHPPSANETSAASGTGASIAPVVSEAGHPGIYNLATGTTTTGGAYYASSTVADIPLGIFTKLALRVVFKGTYNWSSFGRWFFGLTDSLNTFPPTNGLIWYYDGSTGHIYFNRYNAGAASSTDLTSTITSAGPGWLDFSIYWDSTGAKCRGGSYLGVSPPIPLTGPYTTGIPATAINLFWQININNAGDANSSSLGADLVEIAGEYATPGGYRGEELVTNF